MSRRVLFDSSIYIQAFGVVTLNRAHFDLISECRPVRILLPS